MAQNERQVDEISIEWKETQAPTNEKNLLAFAGAREVVSAERAHELLAPYANAIHDKCAFTHISLRNKSYTIDAAHVIANFLRQLDQHGLLDALESVDFADMIAGRPEDEALQVLSTICDSLNQIKTLVHIDLSDNALGEKGVRACFGLLLNQTHLKHLFFSNNGISAAAAHVIANEVVLFRGPEAPTCLETFHFYNNMSGDGGAKALATILPLSPHLKDLRFSATRAQREGSLEFANALRALKKLEMLDLSDNTFGAEGGQAIADALAHMTSLTHLNLRDAAIEDDGMIAIADDLKNAKALQVLDVSGNDLTAESMRALAMCVQSLSNLQVLQVEENELGSKGAKILSKALRSPHVPVLEKLVLNVNEIGTSGAVAIIQSILNKEKLTSIEIDGNMIAAEGIDQIMTLLESAGKIDVLGSLEDNDEEGEEEEEEEEEEVEALTTMLEKTLTIQASFAFANKQREVVNASRAKQLLQDAGIALDAATPLAFERISLRGKSYTECGAKVLADAFLSRLQRGALKVVDLADVIAGRPEDEALRVLTCMSQALQGHALEEIDLSDNALGEKGVRACFALLIPQSTLRRLLFCNNGISAAAAAVIAQEIMLQNGTNVPSPLHEFHFYNNMSGHDGCLAIANVLHQCPSLTAFRYASARAGLDASAHMAHMISQHLRLLKSLDLSDCSFEDDGAAHLARAIGHQKQLQVLKLRDASLGADGAAQILQAIVDNGIQLTELDLSGNELGDDGLEAIAPLLRTQQQLRVLRLDENEITSDGLVVFASVVKDPAVLPLLEELSLIGNEITTKGAMAVVDHVVASNAHLKRLELDANMISDSGVEQMTAKLAAMHKCDVLGSMAENDGDDDD